MSNRAQCLLALLTGTAIDLTLYAGIVASLIAAAAATCALVWWRLR